MALAFVVFVSVESYLSMKRKIQYRNITISGLPGVGSSTLGALLQKKLGWEYFVGGDFMRQYAVEKGLLDANDNKHHVATVYSDDFDREVDYGMRARMQKKDNRIYDSWLSGFLAQGVRGVFKILMMCSDDAIRVDRLANRDGVSITEAKKHVFEREQKNLNKWKRMYAKEWESWVVKPGTLGKSEEIYFWRGELYDLVIDSYSLSRGEVLEVAMDALRKDK